MKLEFEQTIEHVKDFQNESLKSKMWLRYGLIAFVAIVGLNSLRMSSLRWEAILGWLIPIFIVVALWFFLLKFFLKKNFKNNEKLLIGKRTVEVSEEQLFYKTDYSETNFQWNGFSKMVETKLCYLIYMGDRQAVIIPKSAFLNDFERKEFLELVKAKVG